MADDVGYGDLSCYGAEAITTPNLDRLAAEGCRFTRAYAPAATCTPTRFSFLTGEYAFRTGGTGVAAPNASALIKPGTPTIASVLRDTGYATAVIGKWHLGLGGEDGPDWNGELKPGPLEIGFDYAFLMPSTNDRVPPVFVENHRVVGLDPEDPLWVGDERPSPDHPTAHTRPDLLRVRPAGGHSDTIHNGISRIGYFTGGTSATWKDEELADVWVEKCNAWIEQNQDDPFFLFFASHDIHTPRMPHSRFQGQSNLGARGDALLQLDWCVGEIMKTVQRLGIDENTLIVFCSDNGPVIRDGYRDGSVEANGEHRPAGPYSGGKYNVYEGGTRTPFITRWPGEIEPGVSDKLISVLDLAASVAPLAGATIPEGGCADSLRLTDALLGRTDAPGRPNLVQHPGRGRDYGFVQGDWKLQRHPSGKVIGMDMMGFKWPGDPIAEVQLFDLAADPGETTNIADQHPHLVRLLTEQLNAIVNP
jgi:arylsulfatase A